MPTYGLCDMPASPSSPRAPPRCFPAPPSRRERASLSAPQGLKPFLLRADEAPATPSPAPPRSRGRRCAALRRYEFQLAKSPDFDESSMLYSTSLKSPAGHDSAGAAVDDAATRTPPTRACARGRRAASRLDEAVRLQRRVGRPAEAILPSQPGLARWTPVPGATSYHVWFTDIGKVVATRTNAVDEREFYAFHGVPAFTGIDPLARSRCPDDVRHDPLESSPGDVRPVEQGEHVDEPGRQLRRR